VGLLRRALRWLATAALGFAASLLTTVPPSVERSGVRSFASFERDRTGRRRLSEFMARALHPWSLYYTVTAAYAARFTTIVSILKGCQ
jgi:hypothetical protein